MTKKQQESADFFNYPAARKLSTLAEIPFDLNYLTPERISQYYGEACGFKLLYGTELVTDSVMEALKELADEAQAISKMKRMQAGEIVNYIENYPSEKRPALHTATRDVFEHPNTHPIAQEAARLAKDELKKLKSFIEEIDKDKKFSEMIMVGIGGSDLGPRANYYALQHLQIPGRKVHFISNVDPDETALVLRQANLKNTLVVVISKSGNTLETAVNEDFIRSKYNEAGLDSKSHFIAITTPNSQMDDPKKYLKIFYLWDWIGGRYSSTSMVGGVMLAFMLGVDVFMEFLRGAHAMDLCSLKDNLKENLPLLAALLGIWNRDFLHFPTVALIPYSQALSRYPAHIQQVSMESNGKMIDQKGRYITFNTGPVVWGEPGTNAQHSFFQLIHQGTSTIPVSFVGFKENQCGLDYTYQGTTSQEKLLANLFAQSIALAMGQHSDNPNKFFPGNRPTNILLGNKLTPFSLGALLSFYENQVIFQGFIWGINSFDQEGVQLGKHLANQIIERFSALKDKNAKSAPYLIGDAFLKHLNTMN